MRFDDEGFLDDYEVKELVKKFENQFENDQFSFFDADELNILLDYYIQNDELKKIITISEIAERFHTHSSIYNTIMAKKYLYVQDANMALKFLDENESNANDPDFYLNLGYCHSLLTNHSLSINAYKKAIVLLNNENCDDIYSSIGYEYFSINDYENALKYLEKGINASIDIEEQYSDIITCYSCLDKLEDSITFFNQEVDRNAYNKKAWMALGNCYLRMNLLEKAIEQYEYALAIDQHYAKAYINIATISNELAKYQYTIDTVEEAYRNNIKEAMLYCLHAEALYKTGNKQEALSYYKSAIDLNENIPEAYAGIAFILCDENNHKSAIDFLKHANRLSPYNVNYLYVLVEEHNKIGEYKKSLKYLKEIEDIFPYDEALYISYMEVYILLDDVKKAIKIINKGLDVIGRNAALLYRLAFIYFVYDNEEEGFINLEEALGIDIKGVDEFIDFDPVYILNNEKIINLINEYKNNNSTE